VQGSVLAFTTAVDIGFSENNHDHHVVVGEHGRISGGENGDGLVVRGFNSVGDNSGIIDGSDAIRLEGSGAGNVTVINNSGLIDGSSDAVKRSSGDQRIDIHNTGEIHSDSWAYYSDGLAVDRIYNAGLIVGETFLGGGDDLYDGTSGRHDGRILAGDGHDTLLGGNFDDFLDGGTGADIMSGGAGDDAFEVDDIGDFVSDSAAAWDIVFSSVDFDLTNGAQASGAIEAVFFQGTAHIEGTGNNLGNHIFGNDGNNLILGNGGNDQLRGGKGIDHLEGGAGRDVMSGEEDSDRLHGGTGNDFLEGNAGADKFVFDTAPNALTNRDAIYDFTHASDKIWLDNIVFKTLGAAGGLNGAFFYAGTAAHDANDHVIYNKATGALIYDVNGSAAGGAVQFATLLNKPVVTASDFLVV